MSCNVQLGIYKFHSFYIKPQYISNKHKLTLYISWKTFYELIYKTEYPFYMNALTFVLFIFCVFRTRMYQININESLFLGILSICLRSCSVNIVNSI